MNQKKPDHQVLKKTQPVIEAEKELAQLQSELQMAQEAEKRAKADYQNLVRRTQEERVQLIKLATLTFVQDILQPLDHLSLAAQQLKDPGLDIVVSQFWQVLTDHGLQELRPVGQKFDHNSMEVVETEPDAAEDQAVVVKVVNAGYQLNGSVIQHAKVVVGRPKK